MREYQPQPDGVSGAARASSSGQRFAEFMGFRRDGCCEPPCERCGLVRATARSGDDFFRYVWIRPDA